MAAVERSRSRSPPGQSGPHVPLYRDRLQPRGPPRARPPAPPPRGGMARNLPPSARGGGMARTPGGFR